MDGMGNEKVIPMDSISNWQLAFCDLSTATTFLKCNDIEYRLCALSISLQLCRGMCFHFGIHIIVRSISYKKKNKQNAIASSNSYM